MLAILLGTVLGLVGALSVMAAEWSAEAAVGDERPPRSALRHTGQSVAYLGAALLLVGALQLLLTL